VANWIGHISVRNCLLQGVIEGKIKGGIEVTERRGRRCRKLLDDVKEWRGFYHLKEEALDRTMWRAGFVRGFGPVVRQTAKWMNECNIRHQFADTDLTIKNRYSTDKHNCILRVDRQLHVSAYT